jgi:predicted dehydrogenase
VTAQPVRVGLIGLGEVAQLMHLPLLADDPRFRIDALSDASPSLTERLAQRYGAARRHSSAEALIDDPALDAVFILTPDHLHAPLLERAMRAGRHVFVEKPAALTAGELRPLVALERERRAVVFVGYMRRYARAFLELQRRMPARDEILHVRIRDLIRESEFFANQTRPVLRAEDVPPAVVEDGRRQGEALVRSVLGAGATAEQVRAYRLLTGLASHSVSAMRELLGPPLRVAAARQHRGDTVVILFDYGQFTALYEAVIHEVARFDAGIEVLTADRHFRITYDTPYIRFLPTRLEVTASGTASTATEIVGPFHEDAFRLELDAFHEAVTGGGYPKTTLEDSLADLELFADVGRHFLRQDGPEGAAPAEAGTTGTSVGGDVPRANQGGRE